MKKRGVKNNAVNSYQILVFADSTFVKLHHFKDRHFHRKYFT